MFFTIELFIVLLNGYALLCVLSQYQEYKAGRGTAAYDTLLETIRRREQGPSLTVRCSQQHTTGTSYLTTTVSHHTRDFSQSYECTFPSTSVIPENVKSRRVQFTGEEETQIASPTKNVFDNQLLTGDKSCKQQEVDEEDYVDGRSEYLWCEAAEERILICGLAHSQRHEDKEKRITKKSSIEHAPEKQKKIHEKNST